MLLCLRVRRFACPVASCGRRTFVEQALTILREVDAINNRRRERMIDLAREQVGGNLDGRRITIWGSAFKPEHDQRRITAFARVYGHPRHQAITLDAARCLGQAHLDLEQWLNTRQNDAPAPPSARVAPAELHLVWELLDYARRQVATAHGITDDPASERIQLTAWMLLPHRTNAGPRASRA
ncbi:hypothetical protein [Streptomyces sp. Agncl-13]|uniref:hypothetical protein n=1 Tax=Streptomyces sp. Agncl-13 TaxID=3400628 RepID=UPI003A8A3A53